MNKIALIGCGLAGSTIVEGLSQRYIKDLEIFTQLITADCDSNNFTSEIKIPKTNKGSGKSYYSAYNSILPEARKFISNEGVFDSLENRDIMVFAGVGGGSGNAIKEAVFDEILDIERNNRVLFVPILPMIQEGLAACVNTYTGLHGTLEFIIGTKRRLTILPLSLEYAKHSIDSTNIFDLQKKLENLFSTVALFSHHYVTENVKGSFTVDAEEYETFLFGKGDTVDGEWVPLSGFGLITYSVLEYTNNFDELDLANLKLDTIVPDLSMIKSFEPANDIVITAALNVFDNISKIHEAENILTKIQRYFHENVNDSARFLTGISQSPTMQDHIIIAANGTNINSIVDFYHKRSKTSFDKRNFHSENVARSSKHKKTQLKKDKIIRL